MISEQTKKEINGLIIKLEQIVYNSPEKAELKDVCILLTQQNIVLINILKCLTDIRDKGVE